VNAADIVLVSDTAAAAAAGRRRGLDDRRAAVESEFGDDAGHPRRLYFGRARTGMVARQARFSKDGRITALDLFIVKTVRAGPMGDYRSAATPRRSSGSRRPCAGAASPWSPTPRRDRSSVAG
jgi:hypothetical protein